MTQNRFKKSAPTVDFDDPTVLTVIPDEVKEPKKEEETAAKESKPLLEMLGKKEGGSNYTLYLTNKVVKKVDEMAKASGNSRSKVVDTLLQSILFEEN